jgi:hypothetical protein
VALDLGRGCAGVTRTRAAGAVIAATGLLVCGCGGNGSGSSTTQPAAAAPTVSTTAAVTTQPTTTTAHKQAKHKAPARSTTTTAAPTPTPATPPASGPDGLRVTPGYASYDLCSSQCSGSVPASLRRPLKLPSVSGGSCPVSSASGLVRPLGPSTLASAPFINDPWGGARVTWLASAAYQGPVLIRGRQLDGPHAVGFGEAHIPYDELQLLAPGMGAATPRGQGREWLTFTRVQGPGCYAYQVDGTSFSEVIVFKAT